MHARPLAALVGGTTALLTLLTVAPGAATAANEIAGDPAPQTTETDLPGVDESGLQLPGARGSSTSTTAATRSLTTNVPSLLRAPEAQTQVSTAFTQSVSQRVDSGSAEGGPQAGGAQAGAAQPGAPFVTNMGTDPGGSLTDGGSATGGSLTDGGANSDDRANSDGAASDGTASAEDGIASGDASTSEAPVEAPPSTGSVAQTTEDGITIAALSDRMELPEDAPGVVGLVYDAHSDVEFEVRTEVDGTWSDWERLDADDEDGGTPGTDPYYTAGAQGLQVRILGDDWDPAGTRVLLVDPKTLDSDAEAVRDNQPVTGLDDGAGAGAGDASGADDGVDTEQAGAADADAAAGATPDAAASQAAAGTAAQAASGTTAQNAALTVPAGTAGAAGWEAQTTSAKVKKVEKPKIRSRKDWGASKKLGTTKHDVAAKATAAVVHHSAGANDYDAEDVPAILRGIHTFHVQGRGWDDVGYNMFADRYGRLWEGRAGGVSKAIVGAHAVGYNTGTFGISVLGTYEKKAPPQKTLDAVAGAIAWKLSLSGTSADAKTTIAGDRVRTVIGHRDVGQTSCPGDAFYAKLGEVRTTAVQIQQGKRDVNPTQEKKDSKKKDSTSDESKKSDSKKSDKKKSDSKDSGKKKSEKKGADMEGGLADLTPGVAED